MPNPNGRLFSIVILLSAINSAHAVVINGAISSDGYCLYKEDFSCVWCQGAAGSTPSGTCSTGYAGCTDGVSTMSGNHSYDVDSAKATTTYDCGWSGWTLVRSLEKCDRYSYRQSNGECAECPFPDFEMINTNGTLIPIYPRGDYYEFKLTGCRINITNSDTYQDETGTFVFSTDDHSTLCYHSGVL